MRDAELVRAFFEVNRSAAALADVFGATSAAARTAGNKVCWSAWPQHFNRQIEVPSAVKSLHLPRQAEIEVQLPRRRRPAEREIPIESRSRRPVTQGHQMR